MNLNQMYKLTTGVLLYEKNEKFGNLSNFISAKKKKVDKTRKAGSSAIFEKDFLQIVGTIASAKIKDSDVQTICSIMLLVASTS